MFKSNSKESVFEYNSTKTNEYLSSYKDYLLNKHNKDIFKILLKDDETIHYSIYVDFM